MYRSSLTGTPVTWRAFSTMSTDAFGKRDLSSAQAPATWGVAIDVPLSDRKRPPGTEE